MSVTAQVVEQVRRRASFACEYCGVAEIDVGGELTVDHFQPQSLGGSDDPENLIYCCHRCNLYKADYWPFRESDPLLWNPRRDAPGTHYLLLADGRLVPLSPTGAFTLRRLRLNRPPLIAHRLREQAGEDELRLLARYRELLSLLERLQQQQADLLEEHRALLEEQRAIIRHWLGGQ